MGHRLIRRRTVRNWENLVAAAVQAALEAGDHSAEPDAVAVRADLEVGYYSVQTEIEAIMEVGDSIQQDNHIVARILYEYAFRLAQLMEPSSAGRGVLQFKSALKVVLMGKREEHIDRTNDLWVITSYESELKEKVGVVNLEEWEQAVREGRPPEGENPEYQAWRTKKLRRFYEISNILSNVTKLLKEEAELEVGSSVVKSPFQHFSKLKNLLDLHRHLFTTDAGVVSYSEQPPLAVIKRIAATFSKSHDDTLARDLEQILSANKSINKSGVTKIISKISGNMKNLYERMFSTNGPKRISSMPMAFKLLRLCVGEVQKSAEYLNREGAGVAMNVEQCRFLVQVLKETENSLSSIYRSQLLDVNPVHVLGELLHTLLDAQMLIKASCVTTSQWLRAAFEQGGMDLTFSRLLYDIEWHTSVLLSMVENSQNNGVRSDILIEHDGQLRVEVETALRESMRRDQESLKHRLKSMKVADPTKQGLADQLLYRMEAPFSDLVRLNLDGFDHKGAPHIGSGGFGAVVKHNFLDQQCAMKVIERVSAQVEVEFEKETDAAKRLGNHPHLVRLYCYSKTKRACYLIMERLHKSLAEVLVLKNKNGEGLSMVEAITLMLQIGEGLQHIHSKEAAHRDLKPGNILVNLADPSSQYLSRIRSVKIADFGLTKTHAAITCSNHTINRGTSAYMAPEVIDLGGDGSGSTRFNPAKADVYSFAVVCSVILTGENPYGLLTSREFKAQVKAGTLRPNLPPDCPSRLTTLIKRCWNGDYHERPLLPEVCRELRYIKGLLLMYMDRARANISYTGKSESK